MGFLRNTELFGNLGVLFFIAANIYYPAKMILKYYLPDNIELKNFLNNYLQAHIMFNMLGLWCILIHGHFVDERNVILRIGVFFAFFMMVMGGVMYYRRSKDLERAPIIHSIQQMVFLVWIVVVIAGHGML